MAKQLGIAKTQIRRIRADEWFELRSLRLHALADAPTAYASTLAREQSFSEEVWRERSLGASSGCERATFVAERDGIWIGMVTGLANQQRETKQSTLLVAMFVATSARREGIGSVVGYILSDNVPMLRVCKRLGFSVAAPAGERMVTVRIPTATHPSNTDAKERT